MKAFTASWRDNGPHVLPDIPAQRFRPAGECDLSDCILFHLAAGHLYLQRPQSREEGRRFHELWFNDFLPWLQRLLDDPLRRTRAMWVEKRTALHQLDRDLKEELAQILAG